MLRLHAANASAGRTSSADPCSTAGRPRGGERLSENQPPGGGSQDYPVCVFIKPFDRLSGEEIVSLVAEAGYGGIDLSFRPKGHILPEAGRRELPRFVRLAEKAGLKVPMAVTSINKADREAEESIRIMADQGIRYYRMGGLKYDRDLSVPENLERFKRILNELCALNTRFGVHGALQNHVGDNFGSALWDLYIAIRELDPNHIGCQYDIRHAVAEGMRSWTNPLRALAPHVRTLCIKDFTWKGQSEGGFKATSVPLGDGIVDFPGFFGILRESAVAGPVSVHFEYPLLPGKDIRSHLPDAASAMKRDLDKLLTYTSGQEAATK